MKNTEFGKTTKRIENKLFGALLIAFAGTIATAVAYADSDHALCGHRQWDHHARWSKEKHDEFFQKHLQALHDKLAITPTQEAAWSSFIAKTTPRPHPHPDLG